ncbi:MAG: hypothetical protein ABIQ44_10550, partial [Chloroflexia bacterium]
VRVLLAYPPPTDTDMVRGMDGAAGVRGFPRRRAEVVGEEIVRAVVMGRKEVIFGMDRVLGLLYRFWPGLVRMVFRSQRRRFERMMGGR